MNDNVKVVETIGILNDLEGLLADFKVPTINRIEGGRKSRRKRKSTRKRKRKSSRRKRKRKSTRRKKN